MRIGCILTVKNEQNTILHNIRYHQYLGVTDFFVFLDHSTDLTRQYVASFPHVTYFINQTYNDLLLYNQDKEEVDLELIQRFFTTHLSLRQIFNANMALELCRDRGIDWLIHLDADELICINPQSVDPGGLNTYFKCVEPDVDVIIFRNIEAVPTKMSLSNPFMVRLFKRAGVDPGSVGFPKGTLVNPSTGKIIPAGWFWGHNSNKSAVRTASSAYFVSPHQCAEARGTLNTEYLLHFYITCYEQWLNKFRNFSDYPPKPHARPLRLLQIDLVNHLDLTDKILRDYFAKFILYTTEDLLLIRGKFKHAFMIINSVADFFTHRVLNNEANEEYCD